MRVSRGGRMCGQSCGGASHTETWLILLSTPGNIIYNTDIYAQTNEFNLHRTLQKHPIKIMSN